MEQPLRVLMLEDNPGDAVLNAERLKDAGFVFEDLRVDTEAGYTRALEEFKPDVILADYQLPGFDVHTALRIARERAAFVPFIVVSGTVSEEAAVELLKAGATDYLFKQKTGRLGAAVKNALALRKANEEKAAAEEELRTSHRELERRVEARTADLSRANDRLRAEIRGRAKTEHELRQSRDIIRNIHSIILIMDREGGITFINDFGLSYFGFARDELIGRNILGTIVPESESTGRDLRDLMADILASPEQHADNINENIKKNGERVWISWANKVLYDAEGRPAGILAAGNDITALKRTQQEAEESHRILQAIIDHVPEDIVVVEGPDARVKMDSQYSARLAGRPLAEITGLTFRERLEKEPFYRADGSGRAGYEESPLVRAIESGRPVINEDWIVKAAKGEDRFVSVNAGPIRDREGAITGGISTWRDITERRKMEDTLRRNEYELRTLVNTSPDIIIRLDRAMRYVYVNPAFERITGLAREQLAGKTNRDLGMIPQQTARWEAACSRTFASGREETFEFEMESFFGRRIFWARVLPEFAKNGEVETVMVLARDVTERRVAESRVHYLSFHDPVTGLYNRQYLDEEVRHADAGRALPVSVIAAGATNLVFVNDVFGRDAGDRLLRAFAGIVKGNCRAGDVIARNGGEAFTILLPESDRRTAESIGERIRRESEAVRDTVVPPGTALGIAVKEAPEQSLAAAVREAEENMAMDRVRTADENREKVIASILRAVTGRRPDTGEHISRLKVLVRKEAPALGLSGEDVRLLERTADLHETGKIGIPEEIWLKHGALLPQEWEAMKKHSEIAFRIARAFPGFAPVAEILRSLDERWDGKGYPDGLKGEEIPYRARVFAILDAYDCMIHPRPYRAALNVNDALGEIKRNAGTQFDPGLADEFITAERTGASS